VWTRDSPKAPKYAPRAKFNITNDLPILASPPNNKVPRLGNILGPIHSGKSPSFLSSSSVKGAARISGPLENPESTRSGGGIAIMYYLNFIGVMSFR